MGRVEIFAISGAVVTLTAMFEMIRRGNIKEKYTVLWTFMALCIAVVAFYPRIVDLVADATGIRSGPSVVLVVGGLIITMVCVQLSVEVSRLEDRSRALAEEIGLLRLEMAKRSLSADSE